MSPACAARLLHSQDPRAGRTAMWQDGRNEWGWKCAREYRWVTHTFAAACIDPPTWVRFGGVSGKRGSGEERIGLLLSQA